MRERIRTARVDGEDRGAVALEQLGAHPGVGDDVHPGSGCERVPVADGDAAVARRRRRGERREHRVAEGAVGVEDGDDADLLVEARGATAAGAGLPSSVA